MAKLVSTKAELAALRGMCSRNRSISGRLIGAMDHTYFQNPEAVDAFKHIKTSVKNTGSAPLWNELLEDPKLDANSREFLASSTQKIVDDDQVSSVLRTLGKYRKLRGLYLISESLMSDLQQNAMSPEDMIFKVADTLAQLRVDKSASQDLALHIGHKGNAKEFVKDLLYNDEEDPYIPTGFSEYDRENYGITYGSLFTIGANSGAGKSLLVGALAKFWASIGLSVVLVPLEMSKREMVGRLLANVASIDSRKIIFKKLTKDEKAEVTEKFERFDRKVAKEQGRYTILKPKEDMEIEELMAVAETYGPKIIIIDYVSLLKGVSDDDKQWQKLQAISRYCKVYAESQGVIVVLVCQVSDEGKIRYAGAIRENSDTAWIFVATKETKDKELINVEQLKGRNSSLFPFSLKIEYKYSRVSDLDAEVPEEPTEKKEKGSRDYLADIDNE